MKLQKKLNPWEMDKSLVDVLRCYDGMMIGENKKDKRYYDVELFDEDGSRIEEEVSKQLFKNMPYPVKEEGTHFWLVLYKIKNKPRTNFSAWPVAEYWHKSW